MNVRFLLCLSLLPFISCRTSSQETSIRLAVTRASLLYLPVYLAGPLGFFQQEGISVTLEETASAPKSMQSLLGGSSDVVAGGFLQVMRMAAEGQSLQAFLLIQRYPGFAVIVSPRASRRIERIEDLKSTNVGTSPGSDYHVLLNYLLVQHGLTPGDIQPINVGTAASHASALERGMVDVGVAAGTTISILTHRHPGLQILVDTRTKESLREHFGVEEFAFSVLFAKSEWLEAHADTARRLARAVGRATEWARQHSAEEVREKEPASLRTADASVDNEAIRFTVPMLSSDGVIRPETAEVMLRVLSATDEASRFSRLDLRKTYTNQLLESRSGGRLSGN